MILKGNSEHLKNISVCLLKHTNLNAITSPSCSSVSYCVLNWARSVVGETAERAGILVPPLSPDLQLSSPAAWAPLPIISEGPWTSNHPSLAYLMTFDPCSSHRPSCIHIATRHTPHRLVLFMFSTYVTTGQKPYGVCKGNGQTMIGSNLWSGTIFIIF